MILGLQKIEQAVFDELRQVKGDHSIKWKDVMEWSTGNVKVQKGEELVRLPDLGINVALKVKK